MLDMIDLQEAWNLPPVRVTWKPDSGTIHRTVLLRTGQVNYALRAYRYSNEQRWKIEGEHAIIAHVQQHGLPAIAPLPLPNGGTILNHEGAFYALFPFAPGQQIPRHKLNIDNAIAMGKMLGQLHQALRDYHPQYARTISFDVDRETSVAKIDQIEAAILSQPEGLNALDKQSLQRLAQRRDRLMASQPADVSILSTLNHQVTHGDYQESNLFFEGNSVSAIIDWDQSLFAPRAWEIIRVFHYIFKFQAEGCSAFLNAYRTIIPLPLVDLEKTATIYAWIREHDLWLYEELYLHKNQRVRSFVAPGRFIPLAERWHALKSQLV
ncbi:phosphotransferase enzyme family protein [Dictyobacter aurantiacus]|uniref:Aminoglycoside phosphotransferase domain-containing protein n=1 Tax=Dictyobacter aurantiacus TaxID=1936993 RepID=A0A401ZS71_9CHLR|nr:phosphotransferase [Dictyobacter aurantiacus]GCE09711.1 hypothetical protein KDAU_70400 [Dictyobacter aurantiacus]